MNGSRSRAKGAKNLSHRSTQMNTDAFKKNKTLRLRFDLPKRPGIGEASILVYQEEDGFSLVVTAEHGGDADIILTKEELIQLQQN